jgi:hypothetical protein
MIFHHPLFNSLQVIILFVILVSKRLIVQFVEYLNFFIISCSYFEPCGHSKCNKRVFKWSAEQHSKNCYYQPAKCFICLVELNELKNHLRLECETEWLEYCEQETSSSLDFLSFWKQTNDGFCINLKDLCRNFVLVEMFLLFKQNADENWSSGLINLKKHSVIDVHFSTI